MTGVLALALVSLAAPAQQQALLSNEDIVPAANRVVELMEAAAVAIPELARAGLPVTENARQAVVTLRSGLPNHASVTHRFLTNVRAFVALADAVPKPFPFPDEARRQLVELRDAVARFESHFQALLDAKEEQLRGADRDNLRRYADANRAVPAPNPSQPRVVFLGDSITDGWRLNEYFVGRDFVNRGISGQITGEMLGRMKADVLDLKPAALIVLAGTNDIARGVPLTTIQNNFEMIADLATARGIRPVFCSVLPVSDYHKDKDPRNERTRLRPPETIRALNAWLAAFCRERGFVYCNYFDELADARGWLRAEVADDGLHPNAAGYRIMAPIALRALEQALKPAPKGKRSR